MNTIAISPQSDNVIQGTNKLITCTVTGQPSPTQIRWYFTSSGSNSRQQLFISTSNGKYTGGTPSNPSMTVNNFQSGDAGSYQCEATNAAGTVTSGNSVLSYLGNYKTVRKEICYTILNEILYLSKCIFFTDIL